MACSIYTNRKSYIIITSIIEKNVLSKANCKRTSVLDGLDRHANEECCETRL